MYSSVRVPEKAHYVEYDTVGKRAFIGGFDKCIELIILRQTCTPPTPTGVWPGILFCCR